LVPQTLGSVLALLLLVGPGFAFTLVREHYRPSGEQSVFREISEATLIGLVLSGVTVSALGTIGSVWDRILPDPEAWILEGSKYAAAHLPQIVWFLAAWAVLAVGAGAVTGWLRYHRRPARILPRTNSWFELFRGKAAPSGASPMLRVRLATGIEYVGMLKFYDVEAPLADRSLVLGPPLQFRTGVQAELRPLPDEGAWARVLLPAPAIESVWVRFVPNLRLTAQPKPGY
jgi:hypothetical protein